MSMDDHFKLLPIASFFLAYFTNIKVSLLWQHLESKDGSLYYQLTIMNLFLKQVINTEMVSQRVAFHSNQMTVKNLQFLKIMF